MVSRAFLLAPHEFPAIARIRLRRFYMFYYCTLCFKKNPCDYVFDDNLNSKRPIVIIFGTVIT